MKELLEFCAYYEPLFLPILTCEMLVGLVGLYYQRRADKWAEKEFDYDKEWNERMLARRARRKAKKEVIPDVPPPPEVTQ
jgi:hypothetical protein